MLEDENFVRDFVQFFSGTKIGENSSMIFEKIFVRDFPQIFLDTKIGEIRA